jgi:hypothetical protein
MVKSFIIGLILLFNQSSSYDLTSTGLKKNMTLLKVKLLYLAFLKRIQV